jgi:hypothetical protein
VDPPFPRLCVCVCAVREFRSVLQHMEGEVTELSADVEHLQRFSSGAISIEELLGHCSAL